MKKFNKNFFQILILLIAAFAIAFSMLVFTLGDRIATESSDISLILATILVVFTTIVYGFMIFRRVTPKKLIFLSYAYQNIDLVDTISCSLDQQLRRYSKYRYEILSIDSVSYGDNVPKTITHYIDAADIIIILISPEYLSSNSCMCEYRAAIKTSKRIVPILLNLNENQFKIPSELKDIKSVLISSDSSAEELEFQISLLAKDLGRQRKIEKD